MDAGKIDELKKLKFPIPRNQKMLKYDGTEVYVTIPLTDVYVEDEAGDEEDSRRPAHRHVHEDMQPTSEEKRLVKKLHENLGHPEPKMMARSMRIAHAKPQLVRYAAKEFKCEICQSRQKPKPARPAVLPRFYEPGKVVGVDVVFLRALDPRDTFPCLNITDWGTGYQMVERLKSVDASHTWRTFLRVWGRAFGIPEIMIVDLGPEFRGDFADQAAQSGALIRHTAARSPWQAGKTERSGSHFKAIYDKARDMAQVSSWEEIKTLLLEVESAKNRYGNRSGFSPMQRQIGHSLRLPASPLDASLMIQSAGDEMRRILEIRRMAQEAYIKTQTETAITKAKHARTRTPLSFLPGETVYVYRQPKERKRRHYMTPESHEGKKPAWTGPGVVLAVEGPNVWVSMKGELWKVSMEQCRAATSEEQFAKEMLSGELEALKEDLGRSSVKRSYKDMTDEGAPLDLEELDPSLDADEFSPRPVQRLRQADPAVIPVPGGDDPDQELEEALAPPQNLPETLDQFLDRTRGEGELNRQASAREPEPMPTPPESMTREASMGSRVGDLPAPQPLQPNPVNTAAQVMRNERLDGNPPGSPPYEAARRLHRYRPAERPYFVQKSTPESTKAWYSLHEQGWKLESDSWEEVSKDVIIRVHEQPRDELCHPNRIRGALMPRRLKHRCTYMVDECGGVSTLSDNWVRKGKRAAKTEKSWTGFTVFSSGPIDLEAFAGGKPRGQGEIFDHEIKPEDREGWRETDLQEWNKVAGTGAIKVLSPQESAKVRKELEKAGKSNRIIPSRMVRRMKPAEQPGEPAVRKSRWCIRGDKDPDLLSLERFSPTLCSTTFGVLLQVCASLRYEASVGDLKNAFCQSLPLNREGGPLYATLPKGGIAGLQEDQLVQILVGCYGLPDAPMHWRRSLKESILALGYKESVLDPTVYLLHDEKGLQGAIAVEVDDLFNFGSKLHYDKMNQLQEKYKFGKFEMIPPAENGVGFNGRRIRQKADYSFIVDMEKFVTERLEPIQMAKGRKADPKALASDSEVAQMRAVVGSLNWASREGRPDAAASASLSASKFPKPVVQDLIDLNKSIQIIKSRPDLNIKIRSIPVDKLAWGVMTDASFDNAGDGKSQGAYGVLAFHEDLQKGYRVPCSLVTWKSGRIQRVVNSTLAAEAQSLSKGLGELCWIMSVYNEMINPHFKIQNWEAEMEKNKILAMAPDTVSADFKEALCIIDAKALYDHLSRESVGPSQDKRTGLEIQIIRQTMNSVHAKVRWIPHPHMAMDALTKKGGNMEALYDLLDSGEFQIVEEAQALKDKKAERHLRGYNKR